MSWPEQILIERPTMDCLGMNGLKRRRIVGPMRRKRRKMRRMLMRHSMAVKLESLLKRLLGSFVVRQLRIAIERPKIVD